jgi:hypothetical protein
LVSGDGDHDAQVTSAIAGRRTHLAQRHAALSRASEDVGGRTVPEQFAGSLFELTRARTTRSSCTRPTPTGRSIRPSRDHDDARRAGDPVSPNPKSVSDVPGSRRRSPRRNPET